MVVLARFVAGLWLLAVGAQGLAFLVKAGMLPGLPPEVAQVDFTPSYTLLMALLLAAAAGLRLRVFKVVVAQDGEAPEAGGGREGTR